MVIRTGGDHRRTTYKRHRHYFPHEPRKSTSLCNDPQNVTQCSYTTQTKKMINFEKYLTNILKFFTKSRGKKKKTGTVTSKFNRQPDNRQTRQARNMRLRVLTKQMQIYEWRKYAAIDYADCPRIPKVRQGYRARTLHRTPRYML